MIVEEAILTSETPLPHLTGEKPASRTRVQGKELACALWNLVSGCFFLYLVYRSVSRSRLPVRLSLIALELFSIVLSLFLLSRAIHGFVRWFQDRQERIP